MASTHRERAGGGAAHRGDRSLAILPIALLALALGLAACSPGTASVGDDAEPAPGSEAPGSNGTDPASVDPSHDVAEEPSSVAFAACMRANGVANFPDPSPGGGFRIQGDIAQNPNFQSAREACAHLIPPGGPGGPGAVEPEVLLAFAQCMRENGVPGFPDPTGATGGGGMAAGGSGPSGFDPNSPAFQAALEICGPEFGITINVRR